MADELLRMSFISSGSTLGSDLLLDTLFRLLSLAESEAVRLTWFDDWSLFSVVVVVVVVASPLPSTAGVGGASGPEFAE